MRRIVLGTVQLGLPYGRRRGGVMPALAEAYAILDAAWAIGIRAFDTAEAYGESATRLCAWLKARGVVRDAHVVTKVQPQPRSDLSGRVGTALGRFPEVAGLTLLTHGLPEAADWETMSHATRHRGASCGLSVYTGSEVEGARELPGVERVQAPGNVFDSAALVARGDAPFGLDLRSVYLQGLLLEAPAAAERRVQGGGRFAAAVQRAAAEVGESAAVLLTSAMLGRLRAGDRLVVGVDDPIQVTALARALERDVALARAFVARLDLLVPAPLEPAVLDPRTW